ncbi:hypothetical protein AWC19_19090 [Mycobacterium palustre]|uniref:Glycosyltransferase RgtA/B/C/D-like domain-containing protein n=2 Tax=Mycobacterium palustre TaxID=153971 RepID=A0A1X1Z4X4_9MYCO|nr:hypothetical protein AWC19_19090 [Mycobacterium palustre]
MEPMSEHGELTSDDPPVSLGPAGPAADAGTLAVPDNAAPGTPPRRNGLRTLLAAVALSVFGAKLIVISALGSPVPLLDQWDAEADALYSPYLKGTLSAGALFAPHNEHRIFVSRVFSLLHLELAGEWNTRLEMVLGAITLTALVTLVTALLMPLVAPQRKMLLACFAALLFVFPIGYENTLWGFQSQVYFTLLFGVAALVAFAAARPFSLRWLGGLAAAVASYWSFGTGATTIFAAAGLVSLQLATKARKRSCLELAAVAAMAAIGLAMVVRQASGAHPKSTLWTFVQGLSVFGAMTVAGLIPVAWFCRHTMARHPGISDRAWVVIGIPLWIVIQLGVVAYARGILIAPRYMDIVLLLYPVALVAVYTFADSARDTRFGRYASRGAVTWVFAVAAAIGILGYYVTALGATDWSKSAYQQMVNVQAYVATGNVDHLKTKGASGRMANLFYPNPQRLAGILRDPAVRAILPPGMRPPDADNAVGRNRMLLKGRAAGVTAGAIRLLLGSGPAMLALGVGLFFAAAADGGPRGERR